MFESRFERTDLLIELIARIAVARDRILRAPIVPRWEAELRREALVRAAHHSTSIEGNPLSLEEVTDLLAGREVLAHPRDRQEVVNYAEVLRYIDRRFVGKGQLIARFFARFLPDWGGRPDVRILAPGTSSPAFASPVVSSPRHPVPCTLHVPRAPHLKEGTPISRLSPPFAPIVVQILAPALKFHEFSLTLR